MFITQRSSTECGILHFSVSRYYLCRDGLRSDHIRMYTSAHTYVYPFQRDLTLTGIFRIISTRPRYTHPTQFAYGFACYFTCGRVPSIPPYQYPVLYLAVLLKFGRIRYTHPLLFTSARTIYVWLYYLQPNRVRLTATYPIVRVTSVKL